MRIRGSYQPDNTSQCVSPAGHRARLFVPGLETGFHNGAESAFPQSLEENLVVYISVPHHSGTRGRGVLSHGTRLDDLEVGARRLLPGPPHGKSSTHLSTLMSVFVLKLHDG
ncbi:hypothetical protein CDAR_274531 [Caerostris darwini]|uniref:Uncharacterized protein n=1 Tax=Caerostris darwini TaxID=1538125 RepID=A0AAV4RDW9_9ARAC|nr:hypothetical protein CDAR_274531 [Caerostris darwini]